MPLNESDTRAQLIDPQLNRAGWTRSQVTREHYYRPDWQSTPGRVVLRGRLDELIHKHDYRTMSTEANNWRCALVILCARRDAR